MKTTYSRYIGLAAVAFASLGVISCDDYLDITPPSEIAPELYFNSADQLAAYTINYYCNYSNWDTGQGGQFQH